ncbi:MAG: ABC transporter permease [Tuberibacillus sp.]
MRLLKEPLFVIGFLFIAILLSASIIYHFAYHDKVTTEPLILMKDGKFLGQTPYSPMKIPPAGTDKTGRHYGTLLLMGAKFTVGIGLITALIRVIIALFLGTIYGLFFYRFKSVVTGMLDSFHYIPLTLLAFLLLSPVLIMDYNTETYQYSFFARVAFEVVLLALIAVPIVAVNVGNEIGEHMRREYITSAKILGGGRYHILFKHVMPHIMPKIIYIILQQTVQVLIVLAHLGILQLFLGGTDKLGYPPETLSHTSEWSGLIGQYYTLVAVGKYTWLIFGPLIMLCLSIIAFSFMAEGFKKATAPVFGKRGVKKKATKQENGMENVKEKYSFEPIQRGAQSVG